jgi:hypothetical protein
MSSVEGALLRAVVHGGPRRLLWGARFPTVVAVPRAATGAVHLRSWVVGRGIGYRPRSRLNDHKRR